jgi:hypothetical protein
MRDIMAYPVARAVEAYCLGSSRDMSPLYDTHLLAPLLLRSCANIAAKVSFPVIQHQFRMQMKKDTSRPCFIRSLFPSLPACLPTYLGTLH